MLALLGTADGSPESRRFLLKQLLDGDVSVRRLALEALEAQRAPADDAELVAAAVAALDKDQVNVRMAAARLVGVMARHRRHLPCCGSVSTY